jgi:hypothetical protein
MLCRKYYSDPARVLPVFLGFNASPVVHWQKILGGAFSWNKSGCHQRRFEFLHHSLKQDFHSSRFMQKLTRRAKQ